MGFTVFIFLKVGIPDYFSKLPSVHLSSTNRYKIFGPILAERRKKAHNYDLITKNK